MYKGPAAVVLTDEEVTHLDLVLRLYPRAENADLRARIKAYLETKS